MLLVALVVCVGAIWVWWPTEKPGEGAVSLRSVHRAVPNPADPFDEPELRLRAEDDYIASLFGEPRRAPEFTAWDPFCGLVEYHGPVER